MNFQIRHLIWVALCMVSWAAQAQLPDSVSITLEPPPPIEPVGPPPPRPSAIHRFFAKDYPKPGRAAMLSLILPGGGQAYNKKWWKLPIVYGALGTAVYFEVDNIKQYRELRDNYSLLVDGDPNTNPIEPPYNQLDATSMKNYRDQWRRYVEINSLVLGLLYLMQVADAYVDAHLSRFDVSDDLGLRFQPKMEAVPGFGATFGVGVSLQFGNQRQQKISIGP